MDGQVYIWVPAGTFQMGCSIQDFACEKDEAPRHPVTISKGFWLGQTEVAAGAYQKFEAARPKPAPPPKEESDFLKKFIGEAEAGKRAAPPPKEVSDLFEKFFGEAGAGAPKPREAPPARDPRAAASLMNWTDAVEYCSWAGGRLPSEAEWEYAARAGESQARHGELGEIAWWAGNSGQRPLEQAGPLGGAELLKQLESNGNQPAEVAKKRPNRWGLYDMLGNLWEWVSDWYQADYYQQSPAVDPRGPASGPGRAVRGGAFSSYASYVRSSYRNWIDPGAGIALVGFRCVWEPKSP